MLSNYAAPASSDNEFTLENIERGATNVGGNIEMDEDMAKETRQYGGGQDNDPLQPPRSAENAAGAHPIEACMAELSALVPFADN